MAVEIRRTQKLINAMTVAATLTVFGATAMKISKFALSSDAAQLVFGSLGIYSLTWVSGEVTKNFAVFSRVQRDEIENVEKCSELSVYGGGLVGSSHFLGEAVKSSLVALGAYPFFSATSALFVKGVVVMAGGALSALGITRASLSFYNV